MTCTNICGPGRSRGVVFEAGFSRDDQGQAMMETRLLRVTDEIASWSTVSPPG